MHLFDLWLDLRILRLISFFRIWIIQLMQISIMDPIVLESFDSIKTDSSGHIHHDIISRKYSLDCQSHLMSLVPAALITEPKILTNCSLLHVASRFNQFQEVHYLLQKYPDMLFSTSEEGFTALHIAVMCNNELIVNCILQNLINQCHLVTCDSELMQQTLQPAFFINSQTCLGHTVLHLAAILNYAPLLNCLCLVPDQLQLDIETLDNVEFTPLHAATFANALDAVNVLLNNNANPNCCSSLTTYADVYKTPLAQACAMKHMEVFDALMENGAIDQDLVAVKWCLSQDYVNSETLTKVLATYIKKDNLSRLSKMYRREKGLSLSKAVSVDWSTIPLKYLDMKWIELAVISSLLFRQSKVQNVLSNVTLISISGCSLTMLPLELFKFPEVISINVSDNKLTAVPALVPNCESLDKSGWECDHLAKLDFSSNQITDIPDFLFELHNLKVLNMSSNFIHSVSMKLWISPRLCEFHCSHNQISLIPSCWEDHVNQIAQDAPIPAIKTKNDILLQKVLKLGTIVPRLAKISEDSVTSPTDMKSQGYLYRSDDSDSYSDNGTRSPDMLTNQTLLQSRMVVTSSSCLIVDCDKEHATKDKSDFLMMLDFSHNNLISVPPDLPCLAPNLINLNISHNKISSVTFPKGFPADLKKLYLSHNPLKVVNSENSLTNVIPCTNPHQESYNWDSKTFCVHRDHTQLINLQLLDLSNCELSSVNLYTPVQLQKELEGKMNITKAKYMDEEIPLLKAVRLSTIKFHDIKPLYKVIFPLLSHLDIKHNSLQSVPMSICDMIALAFLDISYNPIVELNKEMGQLYNLWELKLGGLQLISPPQNILSRGYAKDIIGFLYSLLKQSKPYHRMKLMLVGKSARGKTTLLNRITGKSKRNSRFRWWGERTQRPKSINDTPVTVGIAVNNWTCKSYHDTRVKQITFKTWDFAGQEDYYATHQYFLSQRSLYLAIWNSCHGSEGVKELKSWLLNIQARAPKSPVIIVGTHGDLVTNKTEQMQSLELIEKLYGSLSHSIKGYPRIMASMIVSSVTGAGIKDLREKIFTVAIELRENKVGRDGCCGNATQLLMDQLIPESYLQLEDAVQKIAQQYQDLQKPPVLTAQEFRHGPSNVMCHQLKPKKTKIGMHKNAKFKKKEVLKSTEISKDVDDKELEQAVRFLHDNGTLLHYEDPVLNDFYFVDPQWLCDLLAHIVTVRQINPFVKDGIMMLEDLSQIFMSKEFPNQWLKEYLHLLTRFEVAIQLDHKSILIPSFLPEKPPTLPVTMYPKEVVCLPPIRNLLKTSFVPVGFWSRLMSRLFADTSIELLAKEGCGITKENEATSPALNWVKSRCSLEYQYGNLTLFHLEEVANSYPTDPSIETVSIMRNGKYRKIPNKNFCGITIEVMDIYPVVRYSEIKYAENLPGLKEEEEAGDEKAVLGDAVQKTIDKAASTDINNARVIAHGDSGEKNMSNAYASSYKEVGRNTFSLIEKHKDISEPFLPSKQLQKASNLPINPENIDINHYSNPCTTKQRRKSSVYETLDLASRVSSRKSSIVSHPVESPSIKALDLNSFPHFRPRSRITISLKPTKETSLVKDVDISYQRSLKVADELTYSGGKVKSNILPLNTKSGDIGNVTLPESRKSFISSLKTPTRSQLASISRQKNRRSTRRWNKPKPLKPLGINEVTHDRMRAGLVAKVMEHIDVLVNEWFSGIKPELLIPCPYCMASRPSTTPDSPIHLHRAFSSNAVLNSLTSCVVKGGNGEDIGNAYMFSFDDCVWLSCNSSVIYCPAHGDIPMEFFVPDVTFASLGKDVIVQNSRVTVQELLGGGSFGKVFKAMLRQEKQPASMKVKTVALKAFAKTNWKGVEKASNKAISEILPTTTEVQRPQASKSSVEHFATITRERMAEAHKDMRSELSILSQLNHENIISLVGVLVVPPSILLEYAPMGTMKEVYKSYQQGSQRILPEVCQATIIQLASGIEFLHKRSIVYRDLKGDNILVWRFPMPNNLPLFSSNYDVHVKLADYGISQFSNIDGLLGFAGTPGYIAPEILKYYGKEVYTNKVDIFSLGMVIYELTTLHSPNKKFCNGQANKAIMIGARPSLSKKDLKSLILQRELMKWCWQQDPEMRPTATQVLEVAKSEQFCCLVDGILIDNNAQVLCACKREIIVRMRRRTRGAEKRRISSGCLEMSTSINDINNLQASETTLEQSGISLRSISEGYFEVSDSNVCRNEPEKTKIVDAVHKYELWVSSNYSHSSNITVINYCEKFTGIEDMKVCDCPILSICLVNDMMWMGTERGFLYIYDANKRLPIAQSWLEGEFPILDLLYVKETRLVYIALENGSVYAVKDDISVQMSLAGVSFAVIDLEVVAKHKRVDSKATCLTVVPKSDLSFEIWVGQRNRVITVLDAENLYVIATLCVSSDKSRVAHHIAHLSVQTEVATNSGTLTNSRDSSYIVEKKSSVFVAVYRGQFITQIDADTKESIYLLNCLDYLTDDIYNCKITSLHIVDMDLFIGLLNGKLLMIDLGTMSPLAVFHCHEDRVKPIFSLKVSSGNKQNKTKHRLMSFGNGFKSYFKSKCPVVSDGGSSASKPSQLLVWDIDHL